MATTIDNLRIDHRVTILRDFTDSTGITLHAGESGILRQLSCDDIRLEIHIGIELENRKVALRFLVRTPTGPRIGHMKAFFELGDYVPVPGTERVYHDPALRQMIIPPPEKTPAPASQQDWECKVRSLDGPDRLEDVEKEIQQAYPHIGAASSIAEMYAQRMRAFQRAGNEPRAIAAFKLAAQWMSTYAGWATSGGEGAALSHERDQFIAALAREFGYDPTERNS